MFIDKKEEEVDKWVCFNLFAHPAICVLHWCGPGHCKLGAGADGNAGWTHNGPVHVHVLKTLQHSGKRSRQRAFKYQKETNYKTGATDG